MSIFPTLVENVQCGHLESFTPEDPLNAKRALYLSRQMNDDLRSKNSAMAFHGQVPHVMAMFERWVTQGLMKVRMDGRGKGCFLARLDPPPDEIWELRITEPTPQLRVFGRFAAPDTLVLFASRGRGILGDKARASGARSNAWASVMYECEREWRRMFPDHPPFSGSKVEDYVTENVDDCGQPIRSRKA